MAKTGYKVSELLDTDISDLKKLSDAELKKVVRTLADASAKRYKRAVEKDELDPAITAFRDRYGGKVTTKVGSRKELERELQKGYYFLNSKTSTGAGRAQVKAALEEATGVSLNKNQTDQLWDTIDRMSELYEAGMLPAFGSLGSNTVRNYVASRIAQGQTPDQILKTANRRLNRLYNQEQEYE